MTEYQREEWGELPLQTITWMTCKNTIGVKEARHKIIHTAQFSYVKFKNKAELNYVLKMPT